MRRISVLLGLFIVCMTLSAGNLYALCTVTGGKIEVSKAGGQACGSIQLAINAAGGTNPVIISVLPGIYNENITMMSNINLQGAGDNVTKIITTGIAFDNVTNTQISGFTIENSTANADSIDIASSSPTIRNNRFTGGGYPIAITNGSKPSILENIFESFPDYGIWTTQSSPIISNNKFIIRNASVGIADYGGNVAMIIKNNVFEDGSSCQAAIRLNASNTTATISTNTIRNLNCRGLWLFGGQTVVIGNTIMNNATGLEVNSLAVVSNNQITQNTLDISAPAGTNINFNVFDTVYGMTPSSLNVHSNGTPW